MTTEPYDLGILGGGQLARMSIEAACALGLRCITLDPGSDTPASRIAPAVQGALNDPAAIKEIASQSRFLTLENEFIPAGAIREALGPNLDRLMPSADTLELIQDKLAQRQALTSAGVPGPKAASLDDLDLAISEIGWPMMLKARFGGYDGKGTIKVSSMEELEASRSAWGKGGWMAEEYIPFRRELSKMTAIGPSGVLTMPTMETYQPRFVCETVFPACLESPIDEDMVSDIAVRAVRALKGKGLFGVELFETKDGRILVNEIAPRPHNTGHFSQDWGEISQFELHVRLATGLPMPESLSVQMPQDGAAMVNLFGIEGARDYRNGIAQALKSFPAAHVHWYEKQAAKPGRKMGHINILLRNLPIFPKSSKELIEFMNQLKIEFEEGWRQ